MTHGRKGCLQADTYLKEDFEPKYMKKEKIKMQDFEEWETRLPPKMASNPDDPAEAGHRIAFVEPEFNGPTVYFLLLPACPVTAW